MIFLFLFVSNLSKIGIRSFFIVPGIGEPSWWWPSIQTDPSWPYMDSILIVHYEALLKGPSQQTLRQIGPLCNEEATLFDARGSVWLPFVFLTSYYYFCLYWCLWSCWCDLWLHNLADKSIAMTACGRFHRSMFEDLSDGMAHWIQNWGQQVHCVECNEDNWT